MERPGLAQSNVVVPGQKLRPAADVLRGHGTYEEGGFVYAAVCGVVEVVNKLIFVRPIGNAKYDPEIGDVIVGRIDEVAADRWRVSIRSYQRAQLPLGAINLPGGEQRRRNVADLLDMRRYYQEGDCVCLEVQRVHSDGGAILHARNARYGVLRNGCVVVVPPLLVRRQPSHMMILSCGVYLVLGNNGMIWIGTPPAEEGVPHTFSRMGTTAPDDTVRRSMWYFCCIQISQTVALDLREKLSRVRNAILILARSFLRISPEMIDRVYTLSLEQQVSSTDLLNNVETAHSLCEAAVVGAQGGTVLVDAS